MTTVAITAVIKIILTPHTTCNICCGINKCWSQMAILQNRIYSHTVIHGKWNAVIIFRRKTIQNSVSVSEFWFTYVKKSGWLVKELSFCLIMYGENRLVACENNNCKLLHVAIKNSIMLFIYHMMKI
jgi:hypothetical protein